jgi:hypothetical protein
MGTSLTDYVFGLADFFFCLMAPVVIALWRSRHRPRRPGYRPGILVGVLLAAAAWPAVFVVIEDAPYFSLFVVGGLQLALSLGARALASLRMRWPGSGAAATHVPPSEFLSAVAAVTGWAALVRVVTLIMLLTWLFSTWDFT